jgi:hypothetical protein
MVKSLARLALTVIALVLILLGLSAVGYVVSYLTSDGADVVLLVGYLPIWGGFLMLGALGAVLLRLAAGARR